MAMEQLKEICFRNQPRSELGNFGLRSVLGWFALTLFFILPFTASAGTLRKPPNNLGLTAYWPFNEGGGATAGDASGNGHTGTLAGGTVLPAWVSGKLGEALSFPGEGSDTRVTFSSISLGGVGAPQTVSMWVYLTADCSSTLGPLFNEDFSTGLYCWNDGVNGNKIDYYDNANSVDHFNNTALKLNQWYHLVIVDDGSAWHTFYLNGVEDGSFIWANIPYSANTIGSDTIGNSLSGKIDEMRLYRRALSASDVYALYKSGAVQVNNSYKSSGTLSTGITAHYTFDGKDMINKVENVSGTTGRRGTLTNFTSTTTAPGKVGQALKFDGINDYVASTAVSGFISAATGTVSVWLRPTGNTKPIAGADNIYTAQNAVSCDCVASWGITRANRTDLGQDRIWLWLYSSPQIGVPYTRGEWIHITLVHANGVLSAYKNGEFVDSAAAGTFPNFSGNFNIGRSWSASPGYWSGDIDEVRTYNRGLSATEIKQLYNLTLGTKVNNPSVNSLTNGLVGYYTFDGGDTDWSTNTITNRGSLGGAATLTAMSTTTTPTRGKVGQGFSFISGINSNVSLGSSSSLMPGTGSFSASIWVKRSGSSGLNGLMGGRSTVFQPWWDILENGAQVSNGTQSVAKSYTLPSDNEWHHLVMALDRVPSPDTLTVYLDGVSQGPATDTLDGQNISGAGTIFVGRGSWAAPSLFQGSLDEARIYNRTLSAVEALQLYRMGK